jgi:hypothetical protein
MKPIPFRADPNAARATAAASYCRAITATVMGKAGGRTPTAIVRRDWPNDAGAELLVKAASSPAMTSTPSWAGVLTFSQHADLISLLAPGSAGAALLARCLQLQWPQGVNSLSVPSIDSGPTKTPWLQEGLPIGVQTFTTSLSAPLTPAKIATITVLSDEVLSYSTPSAEAMVRMALGESLGQAIDTALLSSVAATATTPSGIFYNVVPLTASSQSIPSEAQVEDISALVASVSAVSGANPVILLAAAKQATSLAMRYPALDVLSAPTLANGTVAAVASNGLVSISDSVPEFTVSTETSLHMDSSAQAIGSAAPAKTMFQVQCVAIRLKMRATWLVRDPRAIAIITGVAW